jgi:hypothetical protein
LLLTLALLLGLRLELELELRLGLRLELGLGINEVRGELGSDRDENCALWLVAISFTGGRN